MNTREQLDARKWIGIGGFAVALLVFAALLQSGAHGLGSVDGYFHVRYCALLKEAGWAGFPPTFEWLPLTILSADRYSDHHLLHHLLFAPFASGDLVLRARVFAALTAGLAFVGCYGFLVWQQVRHAEGWIVAMLAVTPGFLYRMEMGRVQSVSLLLLLLALALLLTRRYRWLVPVGCIYTWLYDAFPFFLLMCGCSALAALVVRRRMPWTALTYPTVGCALGLVVNPYFPSNIRFIAHHYLAKLQADPGIPVGAEWAPVLLAQWTGWGGLFAILAGIFTAAFRWRVLQDEKKLTSLLIACLFLVFLWRAARFVEYLVPFATIALALILQERVADEWLRASARTRGVCVGLALTILAVSSGFAVSLLRSRPPETRYAGAARWMANNTPAGSIIFHSDWDDFPLLFFHNTRNRYVVGMDPTYLSERDPSLWTAWKAVSNGTATQPASIVRMEFNAQIAMTDHHHTAFIAAMDSDPNAARVYEDEDSILYRIRSEPPP